MTTKLYRKHTDDGHTLYLAVDPDRAIVKNVTDKSGEWEDVTPVRVRPLGLAHCVIRPETRG